MLIRTATHSLARDHFFPLAEAVGSKWRCMFARARATRIIHTYAYAYAHAHAHVRARTYLVAKYYSSSAEVLTHLMHHQLKANVPL